jgi:glycosidase
MENSTHKWWNIIKSLGLSHLIFLAAPAALAEMGGDGKIDKTDSCYFVVVDRFFDGDDANNKKNDVKDDSVPPERRPAYDRDRRGFYHGGDWKGLKDKLDYIKGMGFTCLYITPVVENWKGNYMPPDRRERFTSYHGYHAYDFTQSNPNFGEWVDLKALVATAHAKNMDVMIDQVYNHMSPVQVIGNFDDQQF